ncbi:hypothetical protein [Devosia sediminis]|uniref:Rap1a immunity protein domain-containing protein n=1 Tax=Devosia sediminis TaxID=2798801 RepID=A0A934MN49_9HYPH|nr:hypothetical protein [Devosia sediminis]MBJ3786870.1 hypothetical protein [Devosia sediminis]
MTGIGLKLLAVVFSVTAALAPVAASADQNEATAVAIWFVEEDGSTKPYYFHDPANPMPRWSCEPRLDYLTKMFFRMTRQNPDLKDKTAVRSACVPVSSIE